MKKKTIKLLLSIVLVIFFGSILVYFYLQEPSIIINGKTITVEVVNTQKGRQQGLSGRDKLEIVKFCGEAAPNFWGLSRRNAFELIQECLVLVITHPARTFFEQKNGDTP